MQYPVTFKADIHKVQYIIENWISGNRHLKYTVDNTDILIHYIKFIYTTWFGVVIDVLITIK